jgi:diadenosine tetraphosphate (Ap4A) HIT family hydrolase
MDDARWPWLVLVPRVEGASEWIDLDGNQQRLLLAEVNLVSRLLREEAGVDKLNLGALGNIVRQLHVHLVGRHEGDAAWPGPVWGSGPMQRFGPDQREARVAAWRQRQHRRPPSSPTTTAR